MLKPQAFSILLCTLFFISTPLMQAKAGQISGTIRLGASCTEFHTPTKKFKKGSLVANLKKYKLHQLPVALLVGLGVMQLSKNSDYAYYGGLAGLYSALGIMLPSDGATWSIVLGVINAIIQPGGLKAGAVVGGSHLIGSFIGSELDNLIQVDDELQNCKAAIVIEQNS